MGYNLWGTYLPLKNCVILLQNRAATNTETNPNTNSATIATRTTVGQSI